MDIRTLATDKLLLAQLSEEYTTLKKSGGPVDYDAWIRARLNNAARGKQTRPMTATAAGDPGGTWQAHEVTNLPSTSYGAFEDPQEGPHPTAPSWASAAKLQQSLRGSAAVSLLNASAQRRRRLALAAAVARQQVQLGVEPAPPPSAAPPTAAADPAGPAPAPALQAVQAALKDEVGRWMERLTDHNLELRAAVGQQQQQLQQQQVLLQQVLEGHKGASAAPASLGLPHSARAVSSTPVVMPEAASTAVAGGAQPNRSLESGSGADGPGPSKQADLSDIIQNSWLAKSAFGAPPAAGPARAPQYQQQPAAAAAAATTAAAGVPAPHVPRRAGQQQQQQRSREEVKALLRELLLGSPAPLQPAAAGASRASRIAGATPTQHQAIKAAAHREEVNQQHHQQQRRGGAAPSPGGWDDTPFTPQPQRLLKRKGLGHLAWVPKGGSPSPRSPSSPAAAAPPRNKGKPAAQGKPRTALQRSSSSSSGGGSSGARHMLHVVRPASAGHGSPIRAAEPREWLRQEEAARLQKMQQLYSSMVSLAGRLEQHLGAVKAAADTQGVPSSQRGTAGGKAAAAAVGQSAVVEPPPAEEGASGAEELQAVPAELQGALQQMVLQMERLQQQEQEVRQRWFGDGASEGAASPTAAAAGQDGGGAQWIAPTSQAVAGLQQGDLEQPASSQPESGGTEEPHAAGSDVLQEAAWQPGLSTATDGLCRESSNRSSSRAGGDAAITAQAAADAAADAASAATAQEAGAAAAGGAESGGAPGLWVPAITAELVAQVQAERRQFLRHQRRSQQHLLGVAAAAVGQGGGEGQQQVAVQPLQVLEVVADSLAEELLEERLGEVDGLCELLCEQLLQAEFADG